MAPLFDSQDLVNQLALLAEPRLRQLLRLGSARHVYDPHPGLPGSKYFAAEGEVLLSGFARAVEPSAAKRQCPFSSSQDCCPSPKPSPPKPAAAGSSSPESPRPGLPTRAPPLIFPASESGCCSTPDRKPR